MPKIGAPKEDAKRPYVLRCTGCGCVGLEKLISRFNLYGEAAATIYRCKDPYHNCGDVEHEGCYPARVYTDEAEKHLRREEKPVEHGFYDGLGGSWAHPGRVEDCPMPECAARRRGCGFVAVIGDDSHRFECTRREPHNVPVGCVLRVIEHTSAETAEDDVWGPTMNPDGSYGGNPHHAHRFIYADDGAGHAGEVCDCGAYRL